MYIFHIIKVSCSVIIYVYMVKATLVDRATISEFPKVGLRLSAEGYKI